MADKTKSGTSRLPQDALDRADEIVRDWPPLSPAQLAGIGQLVHGEPADAAA
jgi:hypothetical protein